MSRCDAVMQFDKGTIIIGSHGVHYKVGGRWRCLLDKDHREKAIEESKSASYIGGRKFPNPPHIGGKRYPDSSYGTAILWWPDSDSVVATNWST